MRIIALLAVVWSCLAPAVAQSPRTYEDFHPTPEYLEALAKVDRGDPQAGVAQWLDIAQRNPGTTLGAECLARAAFYCAQTSQSEAILRQIIQSYPGSRFELRARQNLISLQHGYNDNSGFLQATDELIRSFGAPGLQEIQRAGKRNSLVARFHSLPLEIQQGLVEAYIDLLACQARQLKRYDESLPLALFNREALAVIAPGRNPRISGDLDYSLTRGNTLPPANVTYLDPQVRVKQPKNGQKKGPRPKVKADITVGDYRYPQVDLGALQFFVDGQDRRAEVIVESSINKKYLQQGEPFEQLKLTWRPASRLAPGTHTVVIVVQVADYRGASGRTRTELSFTVAKANDDDEDERDD